MRTPCLAVLIVLAGCEKAPDPALVDNSTEAGLVSASAENAKLKQGKDRYEQEFR